MRDKNITGLETHDGHALNPSKAAESHFPEVVHVGSLEKSQLLRALDEHNIQFNQAAKALFDDSRFTPTRQNKLVQISAVSVTDLGFGKGATYQQLKTRALELGLMECPLELGLYLRMQFLNQTDSTLSADKSKGQAPSGSITIASPPLDDCDETPKGFYLRNNDGVMWLRGYWAGLDHLWSPKDVLVFSRDNMTT